MCFHADIAGGSVIIQISVRHLFAPVRRFFSFIIITVSALQIINPQRTFF